MRLNVVGRNIEVTDAIRIHAETKASKLTKFLDTILEMNVTIWREDHHTTPTFQAELVVDVEHHEDFVFHATGQDLYKIIDDVVHKGQRHLSDFKARVKEDKR
jgi:putative sigma-54 modulation protein